MEKTNIMTTEELNAMLDDLEKQSRWALGEIKRLRAENTALLAANLELSLKNENLLYWIRTKTQAMSN